MGFERHGAALFLKICKERIRLGRVLTLGRQQVALSLDEYCRVLERIGRPPVGAVPKFVDELLLNLGAEEVVAMDFSAYEGAQLIHDLNEPVPAHWHRQFDTVFDGGTLEHVFNFPNAIKNCMEMVKPDGRFISVTIPNNWCGHGFYQFSPELFYRIFVPANGFSVVEMYVAEVEGRTYAVKDPALMRRRVELCNSRPVYLLVHARRDAVCDVLKQTPQQSDYVASWSGNPSPQLATPLRAWKSFPAIKLLRNLRAKVRVRRQLRNNSLRNRTIYVPVDLKI
jgi:hypothetical protein